jgi:hypothetical protein
VARGRLERIWCIAVLACAVAGIGEARAQKLPDVPGITISLPNVIDARIKLPTIINPDKGQPTVVLPKLALPSIGVIETKGLPPIPGLPTGDSLLLVNLPGVSIVGPNLPELAKLGNGVLGALLNQVSSVNQMLANTTGLNLLGPINQMIDGLAGGDGPAVNQPNASSNGAVQVAPLSLSNLWTWSAFTFGGGSHSGFSYKASTGDSVISGSTLPIHSSDRSMMPGVLIDVSSPLGLKRGTLHIGLTAGYSESELEIRGDAALRSLGILDAGSANLRAWSVGGFALLTARPWYTGVAGGGSWGEAEVENSVLGSKSDYDGSSLTGSWFVGAITPLNQHFRLDVRGTLGYHRTQGDAHQDSLGLAFGEHVIERLDASLSARLIAVIPAGTFTLRPYLQAGVAHRLHYVNELQIQGIDFAFDDADTSVFTAGGIDVDIADWLQLSAGVRQDHSPDYDYLSGRFGILLKLN